MTPTLLTLPCEIRDLIYEFYFTSFGTRSALHISKVTTQSPDARSPLELLLVNNIIYHDASDVFLRHTNIHILFPETDLANFTD
ncbi:hypothetical protein LTR10_003590 [Elasticomyces elasticus]|nr:hypothetical protein LTR10_003590 [Elasticomyces elasticus]